MNKIVLVSLFFYEKEDNIRISTVYNLLKEQGLEVELITTDFKHRHKVRHTPNPDDRDITYLKVPAYRRNLGLGRLLSHLLFAWRLFFYLRSLPYCPSKVYCIVPTLSSGLACHFYCKPKRIPLMIDIIDLWPESLIILSKYRKLLFMLTAPWQWLAWKVYRSADVIFTGSEEYARYANRYNRKTKAIPVYLGTDRERFRRCVAQSALRIEKQPGELWIGYGGVLENSYDFTTILESFLQLNRVGFTHLRLLFIGDGNQRETIAAFQQKHELSITITGYLPYGNYLTYLSHCDIALNCFKEGTRVAYSYKFNDYLSAGLAVVNNLQGETSDLVERWGIGLNFNYTNQTLFDQLAFLCSNPLLLTEMKKKSIFVSDQVLAKKIVYQVMMNQFIE